MTRDERQKEVRTVLGFEVVVDEDIKNLDFLCSKSQPGFLCLPIKLDEYRNYIQINKSIEAIQEVNGYYHHL